MLSRRARPAATCCTAPSRPASTSSPRRPSSRTQSSRRSQPVRLSFLSFVLALLSWRASADEYTALCPQSRTRTSSPSTPPHPRPPRHHPFPPSATPRPHLLHRYSRRTFRLQLEQGARRAYTCNASSRPRVRLDRSSLSLSAPCLAADTSPLLFPLSSLPLHLAPHAQPPIPPANRPPFSRTPRPSSRPSRPRTTRPAPPSPTRALPHARSAR